MREALLILHLLAFPFLRLGTVAYLGGSSPVAPLGVPGSRLNDLALALKDLHPKRLSELSTEKIIEMFVQANPRKL